MSAQFLGAHNSDELPRRPSIDPDPKAGNALDGLVDLAGSKSQMLGHAAELDSAFISQSLPGVVGLGVHGLLRLRCVHVPLDRQGI